MNDSMIFWVENNIFTVCGLNKERGNHLFRTETTHESCLLNRNIPKPKTNSLISEGQADCAPYPPVQATGTDMSLRAKPRSPWLGDEGRSAGPCLGGQA